MARIDAEIEHSRWMAGLPHDQTLFEPSLNDAVARRPTIREAAPIEQEVTTPPVQPSSLTFGDAYERYLADPTQARSARTRESYETSRKLAMSVIV
ncbi:hypothetical protein [Sphingobium cupriresistens]|uniref:Uncharacterized protein n=1 Tax=Sphingobium cupriresistens TaxID=1132417 RepID=A0A8G1ZH82_9SPHN|nr:hypothetical protein [Sphingobium cupriresistens]RYM10303.1 hypothetical protein EWH12_11985 [Sphingobium cupriresistens]